MLFLAAVVLSTGLLLWVLPATAAGVSVVLLGHLLVGAAAAVAALAFLPHHARETRRSTAGAARALGWATALLVVLLLASGLAAALPRDLLGSGPQRALRVAHGVASLLAVAGLVAHRFTSPRDLLELREIAGAFLVLGGVVLWAGQARAPASTRAVAAAAATPVRPLAALAVGSGGALAPAELAATDACAACHADIVAQWSGSAHRFASFANPYYVHALRTLERARGRPATRFCAACHDPLPLLAGGFDGDAPLDERQPYADRGVTCLVCHTTFHAADPRANGAIALGRPTPLWPGAASPAPTGPLSRLLTRLDPRPHAERLAATPPRTAAFCAACHKVGLPVELTGWRFVRGFDDADAWQLSSSSHEVALPLGAAPERTCADCHMARVPSHDLAARGGMIRDHRFAASHLTLAADRHDDAWLAAGRRALAAADAAAVPLGVAAGDGLAVGIAGAGTTVPAGEDVVLHVLVTAPGVGHQFPGGTLDSQETWVELEVRDASGAVVARHGAPLPDGGPDEHAHVLRARPLDGAGEAIVERDAFRTRTILYNHGATAGAGELVRYRFRVPPTPGGRLVVTTRLWFREFSRAFHTAVHAGLGHAPPSQPVERLAERTVTLAIGDRLTDGACDPATTPLLLRYAPSATLQGDVTTATRVARKAAACGLGAPAAVLEARAALRANQPARALALVAPVAARDGGPRDAATFVKALAETALGRDADALADLDALRPRFPRDRELHKTRARVLLRTGRPGEAIAAIEEALAVDPEDGAACYVEMLAASQAGRADVERRARLCYESYREDETQRPLRSLRRAASADDDLEAEPIHVHPTQR